MAPKTNTKEVDRKTAERDEQSAPVDTRQQEQLERIERGEATKEGLGGWAALATQRSTAHVVGAGPRTQGSSGMQPLIVDPNDGTEQPVLLEDQLASNEGIVKETEKILENQPNEGPRDEDPNGKNNVDENDAGEDDESEDEYESEDEESEDDEDEAIEPVDPDDYTKDALVDLAKERGVTITSSMNKSEIADAINAAASGDDEDEE